jgi:hypothetical protein
MTKKFFALLLLMAVFTITADTAEACLGNTSGAHVKEVFTVGNNPVLPPKAVRINYYRNDELAYQPVTHENLGQRQRTALYRAGSSILSWMGNLGTGFNARVIQHSCLANAVYFEARSESRQGQLAVALVILKRMRSSHYPSTICGVVYQNASRLNACQFSFACDGQPDIPEPGRAWNAALSVANLALTDSGEMLDEQMWIVLDATHYHADYVSPRWSKSLHRLTKIGRHIFYSRG